MDFQNKFSKKCFIDCHSHTNHSPDSDSPMRDMCDKANDLGISVYAVTDHCECNEYDGKEYAYGKHALDSYNEIRTIKPYYKEMKILTGIELAQPLENLDIAEMVIKRDYDVIIGSIHSVPKMTDFYFFDYDHTPKEELYEILQVYYEQMYKTACWGKFDTLAHLTYPLRYMIGEYNIDIDMTRFHDLIVEIFKALIKNQKALEINTSGLRQKIGEALPNAEYIKLYKDLGGKYLTIGADAHNPGNVGNNIFDGLQMAYDCGFREIAYFEKREPVLITIE